MWPLGHAAVGYLAYSLAAERDRLPALGVGVLVALAVGTQFPDLVDKSMTWYVGVWPGGRTVAHSLFVLVPLTALLTAALSRWDYAAVGLAFGVGAVSHALVDAVPVLWQGAGWWHFLLWPALDGFSPGSSGAPTILGVLRNDVTTPWFWLEFPLAALALWRWRTDGTPGVAWLRSVGERVAPSAQGR